MKIRVQSLTDLEKEDKLLDPVYDAAKLVPEPETTAEMNPVFDEETEVTNKQLFDCYSVCRLSIFCLIM